ncbi:tRNA (N6-threonylcarbamoyladenosine(37)-N6)-methyltransferase TrmO, partial [Pseudomonas syringae]|nr:tRNA (N6-threonylcarbamoyladenosine(37)-N6)-methyltransferase TrmO [Pseudomonas syringae]
YVPYADAVSGARNDIASAAPELIPVQWQDAALVQAHEHALRLSEPLVELIEQCLAQDPRPAYQLPTPERRYGARFWDLDVRWHYPQAGVIRVLEVTLATNSAH